MPNRKSRKSKELNSSTISRRSPRFLHGDPKTPEPKKTRGLRFLSSPPTSSITKPPRKCVDSSADEAQRSAAAKVSVKSSKGHIKCARNDQDLTKQYVIEKRVTRSSAYSKCVNHRVGGHNLEDDYSVNISHFSKEGRDKVVDQHKQCTRNIERKVTRSSTQTKINQLVAKGRDESSKTGNKRVKSGEGRVKRVVELSSPCASRRDEKECRVERASGNENCARETLIGEKRKRDQVEKESIVIRGWTEEQEAALRRAYFTAKPTPHFWKKVSMMVPGKSAKECFERIHSDQQTPPQPCTRSKAKTKPSSSSLSISASKLLSPANTKTKRIRSTKQNCLLAHKTVRHLLQKQQDEEKDHDADLFAILEPTMDPCSLNFQEGTLFSSPAPNVGPRSLTRSAHKHLSRLSGSKNTAFVSPPVLKQIQNKALHEKYIDQLHYRDAKRKAESLRNAKRSRGEGKKKVSCLEMKSIKVAKDALIFEAQDAIKQFRNLQSSITNDAIDCDDINTQSDDDEGEDEL